MKPLSVADASALALLAEFPSMPARSRKAVLAEVGQEGRKIAQAIVKSKTAAPKKARLTAAVKTAQAIRRWADRA
jgi:hypothetical protein